MTIFLLSKVESVEINFEKVMEKIKISQVLICYYLNRKEFQSLLKLDT